MKTWHYYRLSDGVFDGRSFRVSDDDESPTVTEGYGVRDDVVDWRSQRVELETGELVEYARPRPPAPEPAANYEWHDAAQRWQLTKPAEEKRGRVEMAQLEINRLEKQQDRPLREHILKPGQGQARKILEELDAAIEVQREIIRANA